MDAPRLYTIAEAAEATGLSRKAVRGRVDRGQLRAVKGRDGLRRVPHAELERAGLLGAARAADSAPLGQLPRQGSPDGADAVSLLLRRLEEQAAELGQLRALTKQAESLREDRDRIEAALHEERARARQFQEIAETAESKAEELREIVESSWWARRKLRRTAAPGPSTGVPSSPLART